MKPGECYEERGWQPLVRWCRGCLLNRVNDLQHVCLHNKSSHGKALLGFSSGMRQEKASGVLVFEDELSAKKWKVQITLEDSSPYQSSGLI